MNRPLCLTAAILLAIAGCGSGGQTHEGNKNVATAKWQSARAGVLLSLAEGQFESGEFDKANKSLSDALVMQPDSPALLTLRAKVHVEEGRLEPAEQDLNRALELLAAAEQPPIKTLAEANYLAGVIDQRWQKPTKALAHYTAAATADEQNPAYVIAQAEMLAALDRGDEALALLRGRIIYFEHSAAVREAVGQLEMRAGRFAEAADVLRQAAVLDPGDERIRESLALASYHAGQHRDAAQLLERLVVTETYEERADIWLALGESRLELGRAPEARKAFGRVTRLTPDHPGGWIGLTKSALMLGDLRRAEASLRRVEHLRGDEAQTNLLYGYVKLRQGENDEALRRFRRASRLDPSDPVALCMVGFLLQQQGQTMQAEACYARALRIDPSDPLAAELLANVPTD
jgi:tetratricopeptide (TPR) repeat protein